ncbi:MAG: LPS assembly protein LptD [Thermodesulfovibrionales bacterium]|nr:LPS assembly protein LptD [Thermodesulfovibrionales bacterium]
MSNGRLKYILLKSFFTILIFLYNIPHGLGALLTADTLDYLPESSTYIATGNVKIESEDITISANRITFNGETSEAILEGSIVFQDREVIITSQKAQINIEHRVGEIEEAIIFFKRDNYWIMGTRISKRGEKSYYLSKATFTTCNTEPYLLPNKFPQNYFEKQRENKIGKPDWCFKGEDVHIEVGDTLKAKNVTYNIKDLPILYAPYVWLPILKERQSGFLVPIIGTSSKKGFRFSPAFFWAIDEDIDTTLYLDYLSRRGVGKGIELRYIDLTGIGIWEVYHLRDRSFKRDLYAFKGEDLFSFGRFDGFVDINYISDRIFYKEYGYNTEGRMTNLVGVSEINRFLQSSGEFSLPLKGSRFYLASQYWIDLQEDSSKGILKAPILGYVVNPLKIGPLLFSLNTNIVNFIQDEGLKGQRLLINPSFSHSLGDEIKFLQSLSFFQTIYNLSNNDSYRSTINRKTFEYRAEAFSNLFKNYGYFTHNVELSLGYRFSPKTKDLPIFDSTELLNLTSQVEISLYNSFKKRDLTANLRIRQPYDLEQKSLSPLVIETSLMSPAITLRFETIQDLKKSKIERLNSSLHLRLSETLGVFSAQRYSHKDDIKFFNLGFEKMLSKRFTFGANISYDGKGGGLRESFIKTSFREQCWGINTIISRKPGDATRPSEYSFSFVIELVGVGKFRTL